MPLEVVEAAPSGVRILVVDDDPRVRRSIANALARAGYHVVTAEDGGLALELAERTPPDAAIVDFSMPTPGLSVVRQLKAARGPAIHITVLSGHDDEETRAACFDAGADDVLAKPTNMAELRRHVLAAARTQRAYVEARLARERADRRLAYGAEAAALLARDLDEGLAAALSKATHLQGAVQLGEGEAQALTSVALALRRMSGLVANLVALARFEDAAVKPRASPSNVRALLLEVIEVHAAQPARFEVDCAPALVGLFDVALIARVLHHLVGNAIRDCPAGGVIRLSARPWDPLDPPSVELTVFHSGPAAPGPPRDRLFEPGGDGYFCRLACEAHGGTIAYRDLDGGAAFSCRLPGRA